MSSKYIEKESLRHLLAKQILFNWLKNADDNPINIDSCGFAQFGWRKNQGVHMELKFHENNDICYFENTPENGNGKILFIPDIAVFHKGSPTMLFEVVSINQVSNEKLNRIINFFNGSHVEVYEVFADDILNFDKNVIPEHLPCNQIL